MKNIYRHYKAYFLAVLLLANAIIFSALSYLTNGRLEVSFLDVGQGDAILIKSPNGREILIDGGSDFSVLRALGQAMPFYDRSIDAVLATHADQDHIGGLVQVLKRYDVGLFIETNATSASAVYEELETALTDRHIRKEVITSPKTLILGGGAELEILSPVQNTAGWETNDASIVGKLVYGQTSFLLTGDAPQKIENYLVSKYGPFLKSDVLKAGHHGSKNSSSELFVSTVLPAYTVISAGLDNRYGHPNQEALDIFAEFKEKVLQTMGGGVIRFESDGKSLVQN